MGSRWASVVNTYFRRDTGWSGDCNMYKYLQQKRNKRDLCQVLRILTAGITHSAGWSARHAAPCKMFMKMNFGYASQTLPGMQKVY